MTILLATVEEGSFSAAGRKLGMPLPTVSRKVAELETHLTTQLIVRSTRKLVLTESGVTYVAACRRILEQVGEAEATAAGEYSTPRGDLTITAPLVFGRLHLLPVVSDFLAHFAEINVRMTLSDRNVNLVDDHIDMAIRIGELPDSTMIATRVGSIRRIVAGSPGYFAAHGVPRRPADLADHMCVTFSAMASGQSWVFAAKGEEPAQMVRPLCRLWVNTAEAAIDAAVAGIGVTNVMSYQVASAVRDGRLRLVLQEHEPDPLPVHLVHAAQSILPLKMRRFLEFAAPRLRKSLDADGAALGPPGSA